MRHIFQVKVIFSWGNNPTLKCRKEAFSVSLARKVAPPPCNDSFERVPFNVAASAFVTENSFAYQYVAALFVP